MPHRILIVEDERVLAKNMKTYLSRGATDVRTVAGAAQALEMLESFTPDALVMDYGLPDVDGLRTYAEIVRRQARRIDCVMLTGNPTEQIAQDARELGIHNVVCKPFRFSELQRLLEEPAAGTVSDVSDANV
jgi:DNA-binding response OmpR family regulator